MPKYRKCSDVLYWRLVGYLLLLLMKCLLFQKVDSAFVHWRRSIQKQPPRTESCFQSEGMSREGHAASGPNWPALNGNTIDERAG